MNTPSDAINTDNHSEVNEENFKLKPITPEGIFSFACHPGVSCFNKCCHEIDVILTPVDILEMKSALNIRSDEFLKKYTTLQTLKDFNVIPDNYINNVSKIIFSQFSNKSGSSLATSSMKPILNASSVLILDPSIASLRNCALPKRL